MSIENERKITILQDYMSDNKQIVAEKRLGCDNCLLRLLRGRHGSSDKPGGLSI